MEKIKDVLYLRLYSMGLTPIEINRLFHDINNIITFDQPRTVYNINTALSRLGWEEHMIDEFTFELIMAHLEKEWLRKPDKLRRFSRSNRTWH